MGLLFQASLTAVSGDQRLRKSSKVTGRRPSHCEASGGTQDLNTPTRDLPRPLPRKCSVLTTGPPGMSGRNLSAPLSPPQSCRGKVTVLVSGDAGKLTSDNVYKVLSKALRHRACHGSAQQTRARKKPNKTKARQNPLQTETGRSCVLAARALSSGL